MPRGVEVTRERCAEVVGIAKTTLDSWVASGCPVARPAPKRGVPAVFNTAEVIAWRLEQVRAAAGGEALDLNRERARLARLQADHQAMRNAELSGRMMRVDDVAAELDRAFGAVRSKLLALPHRAAPLVRPDNPAAAFGILTQIVEETMGELRRGGDEVADDAA